MNSRPLREFMREATGRPFFDKELKVIRFVNHPYYPDIWYWYKRTVFTFLKEIYGRR